MFVVPPDLLQTKILYVAASSDIATPIAELSESLRGEES